MDWNTLGGSFGMGSGAGIWNPPPLTNAPMPGQTPPGSWNLPRSPSQQPMGGTTRRGSQILDAQGNVIGHYDDNNQPVYHGGQGGGMPPNSEGPGGFGGHNQDPGPRWGFPAPGNGGINPGPYGPIGRGGGGPVANYPEAGRDIYHGGNMRPPGGYPFPMSIPEQPMGVPGSMQQSLYGNGLLRPAMPSMNNQSGY